MANPGINNIDSYYLRPIPHSVIDRDIRRMPTKMCNRGFSENGNYPLSHLFLQMALFKSKAAKQQANRVLS